ncbi:MAG: RNA polymerase sigma factor [Bacteroidia bacterium]
MFDFKPFYLKHVQKVFGVVYSYLLNQEDSEEVTQDVFLKVFEEFDSFRNESKISTWLYRIAVNQSLDFLRRKGREKRRFQNTELSGDVCSVVHLSSNTNADNDIRSNEVKKVYEDALSQLTEEQRSIFIMSNELGMTISEISGILEKPSNSITTAKHRAVKKLKEILLTNLGNNEKN